MKNLKNLRKPKVFNHPMPVRNNHLFLIVYFFLVSILSTLQNPGELKGISKVVCLVDGLYIPLPCSHSSLYLLIGNVGKLGHANVNRISPCRQPTC
jgi:hypothetical protein